MRSARGPIVLLTAFLLGGCYSVNSRLLQTVEPEADLYRCMQLELGRAGYTIVGADRASGWLHAQRRMERFTGSVDRAEIYATVIGEGDEGAHLQLTDNSHASEDAALIVERCTPGGVIEGAR